MQDHKKRTKHTLELGDMTETLRGLCSENNTVPAYDPMLIIFFLPGGLGELATGNYMY